MVVQRQLSLIEVPLTLAELTRDPGSDYGEVFTRRWVVELILDLVGYTEDQDLSARRLVEPSCGTGAFLVPVVDRLIASCLRHGRDLGSLGGAVRAFDLLEANAQRARKATALRLEEAGLDQATAEEIAATWVTTGDFLLTDHELGSAHHVVGNPPYIRLENIRPEVMDAYRRRCTTMRGRSDIYVGFIEQGLDLLAPDGTLGFICADRWMHKTHELDVTYPATGPARSTLEAKVLGTPLHPGNEKSQSNALGRSGSADLDKRLKEAAFKAIDLKAEYDLLVAGQGGASRTGPGHGSMTSWLRQQLPSAYVFLAHPRVAARGAPRRRSRRRLVMVRPTVVGP